jgi:hypothetical protein
MNKINVKTIIKNDYQWTIEQDHPGMSLKDMKEKSITTNTFNITNNNNYGSILNCLTQEAVQESFTPLDI